MVTSFCISPSSIFETGMPVHLATNFSDILFVNFFFQHHTVLLKVCELVLFFFAFPFESRNLPRI
jgi:hypothetical protein